MRDYLRGVSVLEDEEIIKLMENRNETSIAELSKKYGGICSGVVRNILGDFTEAEQCLNDTYLKVWDSIPPAKPTSLPAFVVTIARNLALSQLREKRSAKRGGGAKTLSFDELDDLVSGASSVESEAEHRELIEAINKFLYKLPQNKQQLFIKRYWGCCSIEELAREFGMTDSNVTVTLTRVRKKLKDHLNKRGFEV